MTTHWVKCPISSNFHEQERRRFWALKKESEMNAPKDFIPIVAKRQGVTDPLNGNIVTSFSMTPAQIRDAAATLLLEMTPEARALLLEQIKEAA